MKVFIGTDHNGFYLRKSLVKYLKDKGYDVVNDGEDKLDPKDDFPVFAGRVTSDLLSSDDKDPRGILICGSGQGMCIAANRKKGIRAVLGYDKESVRSSRNDDDCNVLCMPAKLDQNLVKELVETFLKISLYF